MILEAALGVFSERGYAGTTMQSVADAAGVTKPVVYASFANRDELLLALLAREEQHLVLSIMAALPADPSVGTPQEHVLEGLTAFLETAAKNPQSWRIVFGAQYGAAPAVADRVRAARAFLVEGLRLTLVQSLPGVTAAGREPAGPGRDARLDDRVLRPDARRRRHRPHPGRAGPGGLPGRRRRLRLGLTAALSVPSPPSRSVTICVHWPDHAARERGHRYRGRT